MRVALGTGQNRQQQRAEQIPHLRLVRAGIGRRSLRDEGIEQVRYLQEVDEERQLPQWSHRLVGSPADPDLAGKTVHRKCLLDARRKGRRPLSQSVRA